MDTEPALYGAPRAESFIEAEQAFLAGFTFTPGPSRANALAAYWLAQKAGGKEHGTPEPPPLPVLIIGPKASGKSELARRLSGGAPVVQIMVAEDIERAIDHAALTAAPFLILEDHERRTARGKGKGPKYAATPSAMDSESLRCFAHCCEWNAEAPGIPLRTCRRVSFVIVTALEAQVQDAMLQGAALLIQLEDRRP